MIHMVVRPGLHKALSLGHTLANILEMQSSMSHGSAVFYGIIFETLLSLRLRKISEEKYARILRMASFFEDRFGKLEEAKKSISNQSFFRRLKRDKINSRKTGTYIFVIPTENGYEVVEVSPTLLSETINDFIELKLSQKHR